MAAEKDNDTRTNAQSSGLESRHTPGPWWSVGTGVLAGDKNDPQVIASTETGDVMNVEASEEQEANARLIAAAPELLAALLDCITYRGAVADRNFEYASRRLKAINEIAQSAIALAEVQS